MSGSVETPTEVEGTNQVRPVSKVEVMGLLQECAGGRHPLTEEQLFKHLPKIVLAIESMKSHYSEQRFFEDEDDTGPYYQECWNRLDGAKTTKEYTNALEYLRVSIENE